MFYHVLNEEVNVQLGHLEIGIFEKDALSEKFVFEIMKTMDNIEQKMVLFMSEPCRQRRLDLEYKKVP